jgi:hypothetical protein
VSYYLRQYPIQSGLATEVWKIDLDTAFRIGITNPTVFRADKGKTIWETLELKTGWFGPNGENPFHEAKLRPGQFYPRMARPIDQHPAEAPGWSPGAKDETNYIAVSRGQLTALMRQLDRICQTVQPTETTYDTFGHDIRNLLILACTEVESHWRGVLVANGVNKDRPTTADYVALRPAMRLDEYAIDFPNYPWLQPLKPFEGWGSMGSPTRELKWYDAYNAVKHNRENEFERATLRHAFDAVTACAIMIAAQFGHPHGLGQRTDLQAFFHFTSVPVWPLSDVYIYSYGEEAADWSPVNFIF